MKSRSPRPPSKLGLAVPCGLAALLWGTLVHAEPTGETLADIEEDAREASHAMDLTVVPVPQLSPALGFGVTLAALAVYSVDENEPSWTTGIGALATTNGSRAYGAYHRMSLGGDAYRFTLLGGHGDFNLTYYGTGPILKDRSVELNQEGTFASLLALARIKPRLYAGLRLQGLSLTTRFRTEEPIAPALDIPPLELDTQIVTLGPALQYDSRDSIYFPRQGQFAEAPWAISDGALGSDFDYSKVDVGVNAYLPVGDEEVVAARASICSSSGHPPFFDLCLYGEQADLRGYEAGRFRDRFRATAQVEYRGRLTGRFGYVVFAGAGFSGPGFMDFSATRFLPSAGAGLRYRLSQETPINLSLDFAVGRHSHAVSVSVGEAF